jgi:uncharacterized membrane protein
MRNLREKANNNVTGPTKTQVLNLDQNLAALLSYAPLVGLVCSIIWVCTEPASNKFVRFHAIQSIALTVVGFAVSLALGILGAVGLGAVTGLLSMGVSLGLLAACVVCMIQAWNNQTFKLPVVGDIAASMV